MNCSGDVIEAIMSPSFINAVGAQAMPTTSPEAKTVVDRTKYWPQYAGKTTTAMTQQDTVSIFSICEATGHCGSRVAWAIVSDPVVWMKMRAFVGKINMDLPRDVQLRTNTILDIVLKRLGTETCIFRAAIAKMNERWNRLDLVMSSPSNNNNMKLVAPDQGLFGAYAGFECGSVGKTFTPTASDLMSLQSKITNSSPSLKQVLDNNFLTYGCGAYLLHKANIASHDRSDVTFPTDEYAYIDLTMSDADFELLINQLSIFVTPLSPK